MENVPLEKNSNWDVVIVGSGLSGLTAATRILQAGHERKVLVVDAVDWFGGRTRSIDLAKYDSKVSIGGTFALFEHNDTLALAKELNCTPKESLKLKDVNFEQCSKALFDPSGLPLFLELLYKGSKIVKNGKIDWTCDTAKKLDKISLEQWIAEHWLLDKFNPNFTREFFYLLETFPNLNQVSALNCAIALYVRFRGIPRNGLEFPPKTLRWDGGTGVFTHALVENLRTYSNFSLKLNSPVEQIIQSATGDSGVNSGAYPVQVVINDNRSGSVTVNTQYVIVATSPLASAPASRGGTITYTPALRPEAVELFSSIDATPTVSCQILVVYKQRWWNKVGGGMFIMPAYATHVNENGVWGNVVDGSMADERKAGFVRIFVDSRRVQGWTEAAIKESAVNFLKRLFPKQHDLVESYEEIILHDWNTAKPSIPGVTYTYKPNPAGGVLSKYGQFFTVPHGRIHWGGSERSVWGANWMEGAVERGNDVSEEVLKTAGWVPANYDVRKAAATLKLQSNAALSLADDESVAFHVRMSSEEDLEAEPEATPVRLIPTPESPLGLAESLQPDEGRLSFDELREKVGAAQAPRHLQGTGVWLSPQQCLDALKELEDAKREKKEKKRAAEAEVEAEPSFASPSTHSSSSSSSSSSPLFNYVTPGNPAQLSEATTPLVSNDKPVARSLGVQRNEVPAFLLGLTVGVFVTMVATIRFARGSSSQ